MQYVIQPLENALPISDANVSLINFGIQGKEKTHKFGPIIRSEHILQYVTDGQGYLNLGGKTFTVKKGDMFYLPKHELLSYRANELDPYTYYWVGFDGADAKKLLERAGFTKNQPVINYSDERIPEIFDKLNAALSKKTFADFFNAQSQVYALLALLLSFNEQNLTPLKPTVYKYVSEAVQFMHDNYNNDVSIENIARSLGLCREYFSVIFKKSMSVSPAQYLLSYRISRAKIMLRQNASVTQTAVCCGFNSISNFSVQFKRLVGESPYEYKSKLV